MSDMTKIAFAIILGAALLGAGIAYGLSHQKVEHGDILPTG